MKIPRMATAIVATAGLIALAACSSPSAPSSSDKAAGPKDVVKMSMNPSVYEWLPIYLAQERGYFDDENIELDIAPLQGSSSTLLPLLARGDLDITPTVVAPSLFNALGEGFNIKLIASLGMPKEGWGEQGYIMVRQQIWDAEKDSLTGPKDLKGRTFDGGPAGSPMNLVSREAIKQGGLEPSDLTFTEKIAATGDQLAAMKTGAVDFLAVTEITASQMEEQGVAHKWLKSSAITPWAQQGMFATNGDYLKSHADVVSRFLKAYLHGVKDIEDAGPKWTDDILAIAAKMTGVDADVLKLTGGPEYSTPDGAISLDYVERAENIWDDAGLIPKRIDPKDIVDTTALAAAMK